MFARNVSVNLKPNTLTEFTKTRENKIIPLLRKQKGFQDEITRSVSGGREVVTSASGIRTRMRRLITHRVIQRC
jgi:hypothetical protein